jgi:hypothetical protein|tara:strand:- start:70 stop:414 length:345 start_codon:yes stop_codon:yes gene_type:complete
MKNETMKANNLILGAIYINALSGQPCRLVNIVSCEGAWLESFDGSGYGVTVPFDAVHYASQDEVDDYLEDLHVYQASQKAPSHKDLPVAQNYDRQWNVQGYYLDNDGHDIRCRD